MHIHFEQFAGKVPIAPQADTGAALDWRGLAARLAAAHAARQILTARSDHRAIPSGSFAPGLAPHVAAHLAAAGHEPEYPCGDVNQIDKADGKPLGPTETAGKRQNPFPVRGPL